MIDEFAKEYLHDDLRWIREALVWKLDGLSEYDIRRPLTATGTNLLGLVKHSATWEARYFGEVFGRPFPEPLPRWDDETASGTDLWVTEDETREQIIGFSPRPAGTPDMPTSCANNSTARSGPTRRARPRRNTTRLTGRTTARRSSRPPEQPIPPTPDPSIRNREAPVTGPHLA
jgi:hypothetical protein